MIRNVIFIGFTRDLAKVLDGLLNEELKKFFPGSYANTRVNVSIYDFFDYMFTEENYHRYYGNLMFPVLKSAWDDWETRLTAETDYVDRFGDTIVSVDFEYYENDVRAVIKPVEDKDIDEMNELFIRSKYVEPMPEQYLSVIAEEAAYYFSGEHTAQETCEMIENRLQIAMEE